MSWGVRNNAFAAEIAHAVHDWQPHALVDNRVHARYEVTHENRALYVVGHCASGKSDSALHSIRER